LEVYVADMRSGTRVENKESDKVDKCSRY